MPKGSADEGTAAATQQRVQPGRNASTPAGFLLRLTGGLLPLLPVLGLWGLAQAHIRICPIWYLTGVPCAGCGMVRASLELLQGHWSEALRLHPLSPLVAPLIALGLARTMAYGARLPFPALPWSWKGMAALILLMTGVWIGRLYGMFGGMPEAVDLHNGALTGWWLSR